MPPRDCEGVSGRATAASRAGLVCVQCLRLVCVPVPYPTVLSWRSCAVRCGAVGLGKRNRPPRPGPLCWHEIFLDDASPFSALSALSAISAISAFALSPSPPAEFPVRWDCARLPLRTGRRASRVPAALQRPPSPHRPCEICPLPAYGVAVARRRGPRAWQQGRHAIVFQCLGR